MLELLFGYWLGKRARKNEVEQEDTMSKTRIIQSTYSEQDSRSFEEILTQAKENARGKQINK